MKTITEEALELCYEIEAAGASEQLTKCSILASSLRQRVQDMEAAMSKDIAAAIDPVESGKMARLAQVLQDGAREIQGLRKANAELVSKVRIVEMFERLVNGRPEGEGMCIDIVHEMYAAAHVIAPSA